MGLEDEGLGGAAVDVEVARLGVAGRPAAGFEIFEIKLIVANDAADRVADVARAADVVALHAD